MERLLLTTTLTALLWATAAQGAEPAFFDNLSGKWSGSGEAFVTKYGDISARCSVAISSGDAVIDMNGSCGVLLFRQPLGLTISNAGGNKYVGTYTGSKTGAAKLNGTLQGDRLVMNIKWGGLVNGDRNAQMILERTGPNSFAQIVNDRVDGKNRRTSDFSFKRQ